MPELSVIVPVYKMEQYLDGFIGKVLGQTYRDFELILVDDGSPDGCGAICDAWAGREARVRVVHKPNGGLSSARNAGIDVAEGAYVTFLDPDDDIDPRAYDTCMAVVKAEDVQVASFGLMIYQGGRTLRRTMPGFVAHSLAEISSHLVEYSTEAKLFNYAPNKIYQKKMLDVHGLRFDESYKTYEDAPFNYQVFKHVRHLAHIEEPFYHYYIRESSLSAVSAVDYLAVCRARVTQIEDFFAAMPELEGIKEPYEAAIKEDLLLQYFFIITQKGSATYGQRRYLLKDLAGNADDLAALMKAAPETGNIQLRFALFCMRHKWPGLLAAAVSLRHAFS